MTSTSSANFHYDSSIETPDCIRVDLCEGWRSDSTCPLRRSTAPNCFNSPSSKHKSDGITTLYTQSSICSANYRVHQFHASLFVAAATLTAYLTLCNHPVSDGCTKTPMIASNPGRFGLDDLASASRYAGATNRRVWRSRRPSIAMRHGFQNVVISGSSIGASAMR